MFQAVDNVIELFGTNFLGLRQNANLELFTQNTLYGAHFPFLALVDDTDTRTSLTCTPCSAAAVSVALNVVGQSVVDNVRQIVHVQTASSYVGCHKQLNGMLAELLHRQVALRLAQVAMKRLGIIAVANQVIGHLLRLHTRPTEHYSIDTRIIVHHTLQCRIFIARLHHVVDMIDLLGPLITGTDNNFFMVVEIVLCNLFHLFAHRGREQQRVSLLRHSRKNSINTLREAHIEHFIGFIKHHVLYFVQTSYTSIHQIDQATRRSHNNLYAFLQRTYLTVDTGTAINSLHIETVDIAGIVFQIVCNLQAELTRGA